MSLTQIPTLPLRGGQPQSSKETKRSTESAQRLLLPSRTTTKLQRLEEKPVSTETMLKNVLKFNWIAFKFCPNKMVECRTVQDIVEEDPEYTIIYHWQALTISTTQLIPDSSISATHG